MDVAAALGAGASEAFMGIRSGTKGIWALRIAPPATDSQRSTRTLGLKTLTFLRVTRSAQTCLVARNHHALDLARAFIDLGDLRVAEVALERHLFRVPHAAVDLHSLVRDPHRGLRGSQLGDRSFGRESAPLLLGPGRAQSQ